MVKAVVEPTAAGGFIPDGPIDPLLLANPARIAVLGDNAGPKDEVLYELERIESAIRTFYAKEPDQVMREISAYSARLTQLANQLVRVEATRRELKSVRTLQVDRITAELDRQFKLHSRMVELRRQDLELLK